jgi:hypothetical protein
VNAVYATSVFTISQPLVDNTLHKIVVDDKLSPLTLSTLETPREKTDDHGAETAPPVPVASCPLQRAYNNPEAGF